MILNIQPLIDKEHQDLAFITAAAFCGVDMLRYMISLKFDEKCSAIIDGINETPLSYAVKHKNYGNVDFLSK